MSSLGLGRCKIEVVMLFCKSLNRIYVCVFILLCSFCSCSIFVEKNEDRIKREQKEKAMLNDRKYKDSIAITDRNRAFFNIEWGISNADFLKQRRLLKSRYLHEDEIGYRLVGIPMDSVIKGVISERYGLFQIILSSKKYKGTHLGQYKMDVYYPQEVKSIYSQLKQFLCKKYGFYSKSESASKSNDELTVWQVGNKTIILTTKVVVHENSEPLKGSEIVYDLSSANDDFYQLVEVIITNTDIEKKREMLKLEKMREINNQE